MIGLEEDDDNAELVTGDEEEIFISTIERVRTSVRKIKKSPTLKDQLKQIQSTVSDVGSELNWFSKIRHAGTLFTICCLGF